MTKLSSIFLLPLILSIAGDKENVIKKRRLCKFFIDHDSSNSSNNSEEHYDQA